MRRVPLALGLVLHAAFVAETYAGEQDVQLAQGTGHDLVVARCVICHSVDYLEMVAPAMNRGAWEKTVRKMIDAFGAPVSDADLSQILEYLSTNYSAPTLQESP